MKFTTLTTAASLALASFFTNAAAVPHLQTREIFIPPVLYPKNDTVWKIGETRYIVWDTKNAPKDISNPNGLIFLRKNDFTTPVVLAYNFDILDGRVKVKVPWVVDGDDYEIVLFGHSGNFSPKFTIYGAGFGVGGP